MNVRRDFFFLPGIEYGRAGAVIGRYEVSDVRDVRSTARSCALTRPAARAV